MNHAVVCRRKAIAVSFEAWTLHIHWQTLGETLVCITIVHRTTITESVSSPEMLPHTNLQGASLLVENRVRATFWIPHISILLPIRGSLSLPLGGRVFASVTRRSDTFASEHGHRMSGLLLTCSVQHVVFSSSLWTDNYCSACRLSLLPPDTLKLLTSSKTNSAQTWRVKGKQHIKGCQSILDYFHKFLTCMNTAASPAIELAFFKSNYAFFFSFYQFFLKIVTQSGAPFCSLGFERIWQAFLAFVWLPD